MPQIVRRGDLIKIASGGYEGLWRVVSIKDNHNGISLDVIAPSAIKVANGVSYAKINVLLKTLVKSGLEVLKPRYTGVALCPIISSTSRQTASRSR